MGLNSESNKEMWEFIAKEQVGVSGGNVKG